MKGKGESEGAESDSEGMKRPKRVSVTDGDGDGAADVGGGGEDAVRDGLGSGRRKLDDDEPERFTGRVTEGSWKELGRDENSTMKRLGSWGGSRKGHGRNMEGSWKVAGD